MQGSVRNLNGVEMIENEKLKNICYQMAQGDNSEKTFKEYCRLMGIIFTKEEYEKFKEETFYE